MKSGKEILAEFQLDPWMLYDKMCIRDRITGGLILAVKNLLVNYFGMSADGGTATLLLNIFTAGFSFFPIWIGYSFAKSLRMEPIMGGFLGAVLFVCSDAKGLDFLGLSVPTCLLYTSRCV